MIIQFQLRNIHERSITITKYLTTWKHISQFPYTEPTAQAVLLGDCTLVCNISFINFRNIQKFIVFVKYYTFKYIESLFFVIKRKIQVLWNNRQISRCKSFDNRYAIFFNLPILWVSMTFLSYTTFFCKLSRINLLIAVWQKGVVTWVQGFISRT